jgi:phosphatidylglycerophosphatase A
LPQRKPRLALFIATACGLGYLPKAPGTWGSLGGVAVAISLTWLTSRRSLAASVDVPGNFWTSRIIPGYDLLIFAVVVAALGVWASGRVERYTHKKDPQFVVIDEVSGQLLTYFMPFAVLDWKSWLLGFILFRVFDIWKPFPARQAESLPGGWGIMADDWVAGIYAALGLWLARALGL